MVSSRAYELRRGGNLWVGSVVDVDGKTVCASAMPVTARSGPTAWALRCPVSGEMMPGIVQVVGVPGATASTCPCSRRSRRPARRGSQATVHPARRPADGPAVRRDRGGPDGLPLRDRHAAGAQRPRRHRRLAAGLHTLTRSSSHVRDRPDPYWRVMRHKLAITPALVAAPDPGRTDPAHHRLPGPAPLPHRRPGTSRPTAPSTTDDVVLKWNEQLLATIRANPAITGPTVTSRALGVLQTVGLRRLGRVRPGGQGHPARLPAAPAGRRAHAWPTRARRSATPRTGRSSDLFGDPKFKRTDFPTAKDAYDAQMAALGYPIDTTTMDSTPTGIGNRAAKAVIDFRHTDGSNQLERVRRHHRLPAEERARSGADHRADALAAAVRAHRRGRGPQPGAGTVQRHLRHGVG